MNDPQTMINEQIAQDVSASAVVPVNSTVLVQKACGVKIAGLGRFDPTNTGPGWSDMRRAIGTSWKWAGEANGTILDLTSSMNTQVRDLMLDGNKTAGVGIGCWGINGWPNSETALRNVQIQNCAVGVQFGHGVSDWNCDLSDFDCLRLLDCQTGIQVLNCQSVGHTWRRIQNFGCKIAIDVQQGGHIVVDGGTQDGLAQTGNTFMRLGAGGDNVGTITLRGIHIESGMLLDASAAPEWSRWRVRIESCMAISPDQSVLIDAGEFAEVRIVGCNFNSRQTKGSHITVEN